MNVSEAFGWVWSIIVTVLSFLWTAILWLWTIYSSIPIIASLHWSIRIIIFLAILTGIFLAVKPKKKFQGRG